MKKYTAFTLLFLVVLCLSTKVKAQQNAKFKFSETSYGTYRSETITKETMENAPTGTHGVVTGQVLVKQTNKVAAKIGAQFGTEYKLIGDSKDTVRLELEWTFPKTMTDNVKNVSYNSIRYPIDLPVNAANASTYTLESDFEVIKGTWLLNIYYNNQVIYTKKFELN